jgi:hypothetical protein
MATDPLGALPEFGIEVKQGALVEAERIWVPLRLGKYRLVRFKDWDAASEYVGLLKRTQPHLELRIVPIEWDSR